VPAERALSPPCVTALLRALVHRPTATTGRPRCGQDATRARRQKELPRQRRTERHHGPSSLPTAPGRGQVPGQDSGGGLLRLPGFSRSGLRRVQAARGRHHPQYGQQRRRGHRRARERPGTTGPAPSAPPCPIHAANSSSPPKISRPGGTASEATPASCTRSRSAGWRRSWPAEHRRRRHEQLVQIHALTGGTCGHCQATGCW
jgi:hypothetical protein